MARGLALASGPPPPSPPWRARSPTTGGCTGQTRRERIRPRFTFRPSRFLGSRPSSGEERRYRMLVREVPNSDGHLRGYSSVVRAGRWSASTAGATDCARTSASVARTASPLCRQRLVWLVLLTSSRLTAERWPALRRRAHRRTGRTRSSPSCSLSRYASRLDFSSGRRREREGGERWCHRLRRTRDHGRAWGAKTRSRLRRKQAPYGTDDSAEAERKGAGS